MTAATITRPSQSTDVTQRPPAWAGTSSDSGQKTGEAHACIATVGSTSPQVNLDATSNEVSPAGALLPEPTKDHSATNVLPSTQDVNSSGGQQTTDPQGLCAATGSTWNGSDAAMRFAPPITSPSLADPFLALAADVLDDAERNRIANENRLRQLTRTETDVDGEERGFGLDLTHPDVARLASIVDMLGKIEHQATLNLAKMLRQHPLGPWVKAQKGIGDKQGARLLAVIGDPYLGPDGQPRTVSQLWSYCGHGDPTRRRFRGMSQADALRLGNPIAKTRLWLIACACLKAQGGYAQIYYARKDATVGREHATDCVRCGPSGHPALAGSPWSDAHRHADALRVTGKEILRDLWLEAKRIHETEETP